jgi:hypothetical protein
MGGFYRYKEKFADDPIQTPFEIRLLIGGFFYEAFKPISLLPLK